MKHLKTKKYKIFVKVNNKDVPVKKVTGKNKDFLKIMEVANAKK